MRVTDPQAMRALAHPLRLDLIELLGVLGSATAADCARHLDTSQASCSFHLRQLAKYGFVEKAPPSGDAREHPWRLTDLEQSWSSRGGQAADELERVFVQREADRILAWRAVAGEETAPWRDASFVGGATLPMTADELETVRAQLHEVLQPYIDRMSTRSEWPDGHRFVRVLVAGTPLSHLGEGE